MKSQLLINHNIHIFAKYQERISLIIIYSLKLIIFNKTIIMFKLKTTLHTITYQNKANFYIDMKYLSIYYFLFNIIYILYILKILYDTKFFILLYE